MSTLSNTTERAKAPQAGAEAMMAIYKAEPRKVPPMHPGLILAGMLEQNGVAVNAAATAIGVTRAALGNVCAGNSAVSPEMALRLGKYIGNGEQIWINMQRDHDLWHARKKIAPDLAKIKPLKARD